jgi:dTDP-4-dehydrorhamnose reductase
MGVRATSSTRTSDVASSFDPRSTIFTGGSGLLGRAFQRALPDAMYPSSAEFDVRNAEAMRAWVRDRAITAIIHAAAFTSPPRIDQEPLRALETNIIGTANVARLCLEHRWRLVYISTDYVFKGDRGGYKEDDAVLPVNRYAWSKLGGECAALMVPDCLIIRTSFGPDEFPYPKAFVDQWTSRQSVTDTTHQMIALLETGAQGIVHVGGPRRTVLDYAQSLDQSKPIEPLSVNEVTFNVPIDTSLDTTRYDELVRRKKGQE